VIRDSNDPSAGAPSIASVIPRAGMRTKHTEILACFIIFLVVGSLEERMATKVLKVRKLENGETIDSSVCQRILHHRQNMFNIQEVM
jgi:hypothetical protein